jgi:hypothetical protein
MGIHVDMTVRRISAGGTVLQEERTVTDNLARHGARVPTALTTLGVNDFVHVQEVGGDFQAWSAVRHVSTGKDNVRRMGLEFLDRAAPDRLVVDDALTTRTPRPSGAIHADVARATPSPALASGVPRRQDRRIDPRFDIGFEVLLRGLGPEQAILWEERTVVDNVGRRGARVKTVTAGLAVGDLISLQEARGGFQVWGAVRGVYVGEDGIRRASLAFLDRSVPAELASVGVAPPRARRAPAAQRRPTANEIRWAENLCRVGERLLAEGRHWDAIQTLGPALRSVQGTEANRRLRGLLGRALAANPTWVKRAEQLLLSVAQEDPHDAEAYVALGVLYKVTGLTSRARRMISKALEADPQHPRALAELRSLGSA